MQQRLHLARAMLHDPDLIFLDEPTVGIDPIGSREIRALVRELVRRGKTILLTTHYMYEAEELCDRIAVVNHGEIVALDTPAALKSHASKDSVIVIHTPTENALLEHELGLLKNEIGHLSNATDTVSIQTRNPGRILTSLAGLLEREVISNIEVRNATLEDVYVKIIKESAV
jgi:ABC-2 type transport system ATP-binding protein